MRIAKDDVDVKLQIPGAVIRQRTEFGDASGLGKISGEIDNITRQLAEGSLDDLAIRNRYLDYKFGSGAETTPELEHKP